MCCPQFRTITTCAAVHQGHSSRQPPTGIISIHPINFTAQQKDLVRQVTTKPNEKTNKDKIFKNIKKKKQPLIWGLHPAYTQPSHFANKVSVRGGQLATWWETTHSRRQHTSQCPWSLPRPLTVSVKHWEHRRCSSNKPLGSRRKRRASFLGINHQLTFWTQLARQEIILLHKKLAAGCPEQRR